MRINDPFDVRAASGERLPDGVEVTYRMEGQQPAYSQLEVTPISLLNSPPVYQRGSLIAVNHNYICYVVKGTHTRLTLSCCVLLRASPSTSCLTANPCRASQAT